MAVIKPTEQERRAYEQAAGAKKNGANEANKLGGILEEAGLISHEMLKDLIPADESAQSLKNTLISQGLVRLTAKVRG